MAEYIERDAMIDDLDAAVKHGGMGAIIAQTLQRYVKRAPAADVAPVRHGWWMHSHYEDCSEHFEIVKCSNCDFEAYAIVRDDGTEYKTVSPVEDCAFFEPGRRRKPDVETWRLAPAVAKIDYRLLYKLYLHGLTDRAVAEKVGCNVNTVWAWRKKNNLPPNRYKKAH